MTGSGLPGSIRVFTKYLTKEMLLDLYKKLGTSHNVFIDDRPKGMMTRWESFKKGRWPHWFQEFLVRRNWISGWILVVHRTVRVASVGRFLLGSAYHRDIRDLSLVWGVARCDWHVTWNGVPGRWPYEDGHGTYVKDRVVGDRIVVYQVRCQCGRLFWGAEGSFRAGGVR